ncbi:DUF2975 domain-containing protein [Corticibacter populi]|uniref:DUF2975 domain-containing protein n=1 Tax=Corticibacter populi TaxID=1550736 RepID=A0A3M6QY71_9BURK|nr:DUF2975 domain-containing protein [Corticibacter populi]RMX07966.1 DUF2975 domain-containing protein [Corticibacter populi]RZS35207.1 DUF2975 family protein [Corticibacter populi]
MVTDRLPVLSQRMATLTLWLVIGMLLLNAAVWLVPAWQDLHARHGLSFSLSDSLIAALALEPAALPWWQRLGAAVLSAIPLLVLSGGLLHLRALLRNYAGGQYFSPQSATHMGRLGQAVALWVLATFLCEPLLSAWLTFTNPPGERLISLGFDSGSIVALFLAACVVVIARILRRASELHAENQQFV